MAWNGTEYVHAPRGHSTDVVGFSWNTDTYCPRCTLGSLGFATTGPVQGDSPALASAIKVYAEEGGFDPQTTDVPQPITNGEDALRSDGSGKSENCCICHEPLVEVDEVDGQ